MWCDQDARAFSRHGGGFGFVPADPTGAQTWVEYGAHLGYSFARHSTISVFVAGVAGSGNIGSDTHAGVDCRLTF